MDSAFLALRGVVLTILAFGLMIFVHELGHFLASKLIGVRVERFSFGFGPKLVGRSWRGTEYLVCAIPLGGYVKLAGGDEGEEATGASDEFVSKTPGQRFLVFLAGPLFSILFGIPLAMAMLIVGRQTPESRVSYVAIGSPAWDAGVHYGDRVTALNARSVATFEDLRQAIHEAPFGEELDLAVERGGRQLALRAVRPKGRLLGIICSFAHPVVREVEPGSPAAIAGIRPGDSVVGANGKALRGWFDFRRRILASPERPMQITVEREGQSLTLQAIPRGLEAPDPGFTIRIPPEIGYVRKGFPAEGRLRPGDRIVAVNGTPVACWWEAEDAMLDGPPATTFTIERPTAGANATTLIPHTDDQAQLAQALQDALKEPRSESLTIEIPRGEGVLLTDSIGIAPKPAYEVAAVHRQAQPPLVPGDRIVRVGRAELAPVLLEQALYTPLDDLLGRLGSTTRPTTLTVRRRLAPVAARLQLTLGGLAWAVGPEEADLAVTVPPGTRMVGQLGLGPTPADVLHKESVLGSIGPAFDRTVDISTFVFKIIGKLFQRDVQLSELMGPVGIVQVTYQSATRGWSDLFWLIHLITVNIGVFNILPVPPLDGGRIVMLGYEKLRGKRPSRKVQEAVILAGFCLVILLIIIATWNDFSRLFF